MKTIDRLAFYESGLTSLSVPASVDTIDDYAFYECSNLNTVTLQEGLKSIGTGAFASTGLKSVEIPKGVETIDLGAFAECESLTTVTLNDGLVKISGGAFYDSPVTKIISHNERLVMSENDMELIDTETETLVVFLCSKLEREEYQISDNVKIIGDSAFYKCSDLETVTLNEGLMEISEYAFQSSGLVTVNFSTTVSSIGYAAFSWTNLESIDIPENVKTIGRNAFQDCHSLTTVTLHI